ncbi:MAG TPA: acyl-CoA dehydrogenase family protein [Solirubrobacteraceae bacterium]|nr:acyl-CoA dehydrogenase family protein [Solirubrobacteraceae bacterium]
MTGGAGAAAAPSAEMFAVMVREVRRFVRSEVVPLEAQIDESDEIPGRIRAQAAELGLYGFALPAQHGGIGLTAEQEVQLVFELGWTTPALRSMIGTNNGIAGQVLVLGGTPEQQRRMLPRLASGEVTAAFALTEPEAGSSPADLTTTARRDGDAGEWVLDGTKRFITNAPTAGLFMVFARSSGETGSADGISAFAVPADTPGLTVGPRDHKMGQAGAWTADVILDGVRVGTDALIGGIEGRGYRTALACLAHGRLHIAALCVGLAARLVEESLARAIARRQGGRPIAEHQLVAAMLADSQTDLLAGRALVLETARAFDAGSDTRLGPACAKLFASEMVGRVADRAVQIHGGMGYMRGIAVERFYRDARLFRIYEGTSQIQQLVIASELIRNRRRANPTRST